MTMRYLKASILFTLLFIFCGAAACEDNSADSLDRQRQEQIQRESSAQVGMPAIKNFREKKLLKDILELRDQSGLITYTYIFSEQTGKIRHFCDSIGYGIPYSAQFSNPEKIVKDSQYGFGTLPQAEPNGMFTPPSAEGTWIMCKDPNGASVRPVYVEPRVIVSPFKLPTD